MAIRPKRSDRSGPPSRARATPKGAKLPPAARATPASRSVRGHTASRAEKSAARRGAIIAAAVEEFCDRGYAATRLDDIAARAGVAKGTIYLHFADKEALFQDIISTMFVPVVSRAIEPAPPPGVPIKHVLGAIADMFVRDVFTTRRRDILRLLLAEGPRFPKLAEFHYENVVKRALAGVTVLLKEAALRGELRSAAVVDFPQIVVAPCIVGVVWSGLFERFAPLDLAAMMRAHLDMLFVEDRAP
jgi:AcrR family transcriptional regulator